MSKIAHRFPVEAPRYRVFAACSTPAGLDAWWTERSRGQPGVGNRYELDFGPGYVWQARVTQYDADRLFELEMIQADGDWLGTCVGFELTGDEQTTQVDFWHAGWPDANDHFRTSSYCWAMYLRLMTRFVTSGEIVPYAQRLEA